MAQTYDIWARAEITRLRDEADAIERALERFNESRGSPVSAGVRSNGAARSHTPRMAPTVARKGSKRSFVLARIGEQIGGATTSEVWDQVQRVYPDMKRSSLRALLYLEARSGNIERRASGRYVLKQEGSSASTLDPSN
jgi:hypothetical protein